MEIFRFVRITQKLFNITFKKDLKDIIAPEDLSTEWIYF